MLRRGLVSCCHLEQFDGVDLKASCDFLDGRQCGVSDETFTTAYECSVNASTMGELLLREATFFAQARQILGEASHKLGSSQQRYVKSHRVF